MRNLLQHMRANAVAYLALFVALGGTSYAAGSLAANSVGTKQLKSKSVTPGKLAPATLAMIQKASSVAGPAGAQGATGAKGESGAKGEQGLRGEQGIQGEQGVPGPTASASSTLNTGVVVNNGTNQFVPVLSTTITTTFDGRIMADASLSMQRMEGVGDAGCRLQIAPSPFSTFTNMSQTGDLEIVKGENYYTQVPVTGAATEPAGVYEVQVQCFGSSKWYVFSADLTALAAAS